ncbi:MAG TPA: response regulator transcription factor [Anaerolineae bacterium]|jgi:DNA-binding NarL/FixJ family response regulator
MRITRVILADDHPLVRASIRNMLNAAPGIEVIGEASNGSEALSLVDNLAPDVLLLDMEMPGLTGVEVAQKLQQIDSPVHVLALSAYDDTEYISGLLASGAAGYLTKDEAPHTIIKAVQGVARGETGWLSRRVSTRLDRLTSGQKSEETALTGQEIAVLRLIVAGKTNTEIGLLLGTALKTVEKEIQSLLDKLGVTSRVEAAVRAVQERLV